MLGKVKGLTQTGEGGWGVTKREQEDERINVRKNEGE